MKLNILKYIFIIFIIIILILSVFKIKSDEENKKNAVQLKEIEEVVGTEIKLGIVSFDTMNPILTSNRYVQDITKLIYEPLITITSDYKAEPCLAKEWAKQSGTEYIIKLRDNVKWSDGESFTSEDVKFTINAIMNTNSIYKANIAHVVNVEIIDDTMLKIILDSEVPFFEYNLTFPIIQKNFYNNKEITNDLVPIGTGMFKVEKIQDSSLILRKNINYWGGLDTLLLEKITLNIYSSVGELYNSFKMGNIDFISTENINVTEYIGTIGYRSKEQKGREHTFIVFNTNNNLLSQLTIRKAICYSIDKTNIVSSIYKDKYYTSSFPLDYGTWIYQENNSSSGYNTEQTRQLLIEDGWTLKNKSWQKTVDYNTQKIYLNFVIKASDSFKAQVAENIKSQLENQGIIINLIKATDSQYQKYLENKNYDMILCSANLSISPDLTTFFGEKNLANYKNEEVTSIMNEVKNITDEEKLKEKYKKLVDIYKTDMPYLSLYNNRYTVAYNTELSGNIESNWYYQFYNINSWHK